MNVSLRRLRPHSLDCFAHHRLELHRHFFNSHLPAEDGRDIEQIVDETFQGLRVSFNHREPARKFILGKNAAQHHVDPTDDRSQRRPQLVRQGRQKLILGSIRRLSLLACLSFFLVQARIIDRQRNAIGDHL